MPRLKLSKRPWLRTTLLVLCLIALIVAIWVAGPMIPVLVFGTIWLRLLITVVLLSIFFGVWFIRWRRRKKAAEALEDAIIPVEPTGDGQVLAERMQTALATLKKTGGASYLYDLPWYVIIGPPGAGKTTALVNSGIEFPLAGDAAAGLEGFGGTRFCDWWFAEDAILIDTAGRYTTQDSDAVADETSWQAFLDLLKKSRPNQPINGVILAFSVEDMMTANEETLARHAETVRARLAEVHETLKIDFPVYVLFTKADLISGFREYFSSFSMARRNGVWGVTFQTKDRKALTHEGAAAEFDALVSRLSDEVIDRLNEEPDGIARIAIFGLPGQMALMRDNVSEFLRRVFEPTRYKTNAILRGFYFTSGTQEGTPIDQVLGAMSRIGEGAGGGFASSFMSGKGKSFFIYDLLRKVIFEERDWVSHDRRAVRRTAIFRGVSIGLIVLCTAGLLGALSYSYWKNATLVRQAQIEVNEYARIDPEELKLLEIEDAQLNRALPLLNRLGAMPAAYGENDDTTVWETFGLNQRRRLREAAEESYSDALEKMFRPRLTMAMEQQMPYIINRGNTTEIYQALKVYMLLTGAVKRKGDDAIKAHFDRMWRDVFTDRSSVDLREQLTGHLDAMLKLDETAKLLVTPDDATISNARNEIGMLPLVDQAYALIMDGVEDARLSDWVLTERTGTSSNIVFDTKDGSDITSLKVPGVFTYEGFWSYFYPQLDVIGDRLREDQWVLGEEAAQADRSAQLDRLDGALQERYRQDFRQAWEEMFNNLALASMAADKPNYNALGAAASASASPILLLVREVDKQTKLTREFDGLTADMFGADGINTDVGSIGASVGDSVVSRMRSRSSGVQRILMDAVLGKGGSGAGGATSGSGGGSSNSVIEPIEDIENDFAMWHELLEGEPGQRAIDAVLGNLGQVWKNLRLAARNPGQSAVLMPQLLNNLTQYNSQMPPTLAGLVNEAEQDFQKGASDANLATMNRALTDKITYFCRETITSSYPFANTQRSVSLDNFTKFFGPNGDMNDFYETYLADYVERTPQGLRYLEDKPLAARLSTATLRQFERAERIRQAFFSGGTTPMVEISISHMQSHPSIEEARLVINDMEVITKKGDSPKTVVWPGQGKATVLELQPTMTRGNGMQLRGSSWTFIEFLRSARTRNQKGDTLSAVYDLSGRTITYDFTINAVTNPFTMRELRDFKCPKSLD